VNSGLSELRGEKQKTQGHDNSMKTTIEHQLCGVLESGETRGITGGVGVCAVSRSKDFVIEHGLAARFVFGFISLCVADVCLTENAWT